MSGFGGVPNRITTEYLIEVKRGNVPGVRHVKKFGRNNNVGSGVWEHISMTPFSTANFLQAPVAMRVKAGGNAADTVGGAGAIKVYVNGIDVSFNEITAELDPAGAAASSPTTELFWRVHRAWVDAGSYGGTNVGDVVIEDAAGANDFITVVAGEAQSQYAGYTIPAGETGYLLKSWGDIDSGKSADIKLVTRQGTDVISAPFPAVRLKHFWDGIIGKYESEPNGVDVVVPEKTDIWMEANGGSVGTEVTGNFELLIYSNT